MPLDLLWTVAGAVLVGIFGILVALFLLGVDRILTARMQARIGPPLSQPLTDIRKLFSKENVVPANAIPWLFNLAPVVALASAITILLYITTIDHIRISVHKVLYMIGTRGRLIRHQHKPPTQFIKR